MLAIRMQRTGRKGHAMFRVVVQDSRRTPTSGRVVAQIGSYDPHAKTVNLQKDKATFYLEHGAQPSARVVKLLSGEGVALPNWVKQVATGKSRTTRNPDKRRSTRPAANEETSTVTEPEAQEAIADPTASADGQGAEPAQSETATAEKEVPDKLEASEK